MKKYVKILTLASAGLALTTFLASCGNSMEVTEKDKFDYNLVSGVGLLSNIDLSPKTKLTSNNITELTEDEKNDIIKNLDLAQTTVNGGLVKSERKASDKEGYEYCYTLSAETIVGTNDVYTFYYNGDISENSSKKKENEVKEKIDGVCYIDGKEYTVSGKREVEDDEEELHLHIKYDEKNYVHVKSEKEDDEEEFQYTLVQDGKEVLKTKLEYEVDEDGEIEMEFKSQTSNGEMKYEYDFYNKDNKSYIDVEIQKNNDKIEKTILVSIVDGKPSYQFI